MAQDIIINGKFLIAAPTGVHRVAAELTNALHLLQSEGHPATEGFDLSIWYPAAGSTNAAAITLPAKRVVRPATGRLWEQIILPLAKRLRSRQQPLLLSLCNVGPMLSANAITMFHDAQVHLSPASYSWAFRAWYRLVQPILGRRNRAILTVSEFSRQAIAQTGLAPLERIFVVHNGVDHALRETADTSILARLGLDNGGRPFVLGLSNTQAHKNLAVVLHAFADPALDGIDLVLFGSASADDFRKAGLVLPANVHFAGRVDDAQLRALMEAALVLAFPSTTEGFGLPPLEAMLLGCPALVAPCGALPEVCGHGAPQVAPDDPAAWRTQILRMANDPVWREQWVQRGRAQALRFTWRAAALALAATLDNVAAGPRAKR